MEDFPKIVQWLFEQIGSFFKALADLRKHPRKVLFAVACAGPLPLIKGGAAPWMACLFVAVIFVLYLVADWLGGKREVRMAELRLQEKELVLNNRKSKRARKPRNPGTTHGPN